MKRIKLGSKVKDNLTGFIGFAVAKATYMNGCVQYEIEPSQLKDGVPQKSYWLDEQRVKIVEEEKLNPLEVPALRLVGGPQNNPPRKHPPSLARYEAD